MDKVKIIVYFGNPEKLKSINKISFALFISRFSVFEYLFKKRIFRGFRILSSRMFCPFSQP